METLSELEVLDVSYNGIVSLAGLNTPFPYLFYVNAAGNFVRDVGEVEHLARHALLRELILDGNPLTEATVYRLQVVFAIQQLSELDRVVRASLFRSGWFSMRMEERMDFPLDHFIYSKPPLVCFSSPT